MSYDHSLIYASLPFHIIAVSLYLVTAAEEIYSREQEK